MLTGTVSGQNSVSGTLVDTAQKGLPDINVLLLHVRDSSLFKGAVSSHSGRFQFDDIPPGTYLIRATAIGYRQVYLPAFQLRTGTGKTDLAVVVLEKEAKQLSEVVVRTQKPLLELKADRLVVNVKNSITAAGSTALEVLQRAPGVGVNQQAGTLSVSGKDGVIIMINGKVSPMPASAVVQMLSGMNASDIDRIEVITTPPANFDAEGNAGIINIVLLRNNIYGTNGTSSVSAGYGGNGPVYMASASFNTRTARSNIYGSFSFSRTAWDQDFFNYRKVSSNGDLLETNSDTYRKPVQLNYNARLGFDHTLDKKTVLGFLLSGYSNKWSMGAENYISQKKNHLQDSITRMKLYEINHWKNFSVNVNLVHHFREGEKITVDADYLYFKDRQPVDYANDHYDKQDVFLFSDEILSRKFTPINIWVGKTDYSKKLGNKLTLETGGKFAINRFRNDILVQNNKNGTWLTDSALSVNASLQEDIWAAYLSVDAAVNPETNIKAGLRYEHTFTKLESLTNKNIVNRKFGSLFPTLYFSKKLDEKNSFSLSYNRRITRPTFNEMAPFVIFIDPNTYFSGNPALRPAISNAVSASWSYRNKIASLSYTQQTDAITRFQSRVDSVANKQSLVSENIKSIRNISGFLSAPVKATSWWSMQYNLTGNWQQVTALISGDLVTIEQLNWNFSSIQNFKLPKDFGIELFFLRQSKGLSGTGVTSAFALLNLGIQKKMAKAGNLALNLSDVFNSNRLSWKTDIPEQNLYTSFRGQFNPRRIRLTWSVNFGKTEVKAKRNRTTGGEEDKRVD